MAISDERLEARPGVGESRGPCYHLPQLALSSHGRKKQTFLSSCAVNVGVRDEARLEPDIVVLVI